MAVASVLVLVTGCAEPEVPLDAEPDPVVAEDPVEEPDDSDELREHLAGLQATLSTIREALLDAEAAGSVEAAGTAIARARTALVAEADDPAPDGAAPELPLLPAETVERTGSAAMPDLLTTTLTLAQDVGGALGRDTAAILRDPIAGDLGAWQRDPAGMVGLAREVATSSTDVPALEVAILELDGEGTRALAWTFVAEVAADPEQDDADLDLVHAAAERARAHIELIALAIDELLGGAA